MSWNTRVVSIGIGQRMLEYDRNYGIDKRCGWTAHVGPCVMVQFVGFWKALRAVVWTKEVNGEFVRL